MSRRSMVFATVATLALPFAASTAGAQSAEDVLQTAAERYEKRMAGIDNYTLVQDVMGYETTTYLEKTEVGGHVVFRSPNDDEEGMEGLYAGLDRAAAKANMKGREKVEGEECFVVSVDDLQELEFGDEAMAEEEGEFRPKQGTFFIDTDDYVLRKVHVDGEMEREDQVHPVTMVALFQDYRAVEGMLHPFRTMISMEGAAAVSEEEMQEAREAMKQLEEQLESMPEAQREAVEKMVRPQMEQLEKMVKSDRLEFTMQVKELRVNSGPPEGR